MQSAAVVVLRKLCLWAAVREVHTSQGKHRAVATAFERWLPADAKRAARELSAAEAAAAFGDWLQLNAGSKPE